VIKKLRSGRGRLLQIRWRIRTVFFIMWREMEADWLPGDTNQLILAPRSCIRPWLADRAGRTHGATETNLHKFGPTIERTSEPHQAHLFFLFVLAATAKAAAALSRFLSAGLSPAAARLDQGTCSPLARQPQPASLDRSNNLTQHNSHGENGQVMVRT
jgi:hypothetical protein